MQYQRTTPVPNIILDTYLSILTPSELKVLLVIVRQTYGWIDKTTGKRKLRDRISHSQFMAKTNLSRRMITKTIKSLVAKGYIVVADQKGNVLSATQRKGRSVLYYSLTLFSPEHFHAPTSALSISHPVHSSAHNKTNYTKLTETKRKNDIQSIREVIEKIQEYLSQSADS